MVSLLTISQVAFGASYMGRLGRMGRQMKTLRQTNALQGSQEAVAARAALGQGRQEAVPLSGRVQQAAMQPQGSIARRTPSMQYHRAAEQLPLVQRVQAAGQEGADQTQQSGWWARLLGALGIGGAVYKAYQDSGDRIVYAQENDPLYSEALNDLQEYRDTHPGQPFLLQYGRNDTWYALNMLWLLLNKTTPKDEYKSLSQWIKRLGSPENIESQNPDFYLDVIKAMVQSYENATANERLILNEKLVYIFGGQSDSEKYFSKQLKGALNTLLERTRNVPKAQATLEDIAQLVGDVAEFALLSEWQKERPISWQVTHDANLARPKDAPIFDRERMVHEGDGAAVEGYWALYSNPGYIGGPIKKGSKDFYEGKYPEVKANPEPMPNQDEFLARLSNIEKSAFKQRFLGVSPSRFEDIHVGNTEYSINDPKTGTWITWPESFGPYYVRRFNVRPSREFYDFVMNYESDDEVSASSRVME